MLNNMQRFIPFTQSELQVEKKGDEQVIRGYAALFGVETGVMFNESHGYKEIIQKGFFQNALKLNEPIFVLFNHDANFVIAERLAGTMKIDEDKRGLPFESMVPDSQIIRDLVVGPIIRGEIKGCSFSALVDYESEEYDEKSNTFTLMAGGAKQLIDVSPVTNPAYPATDVEARSARIMRKIRKIEPVLITKDSLEYQKFKMMAMRRK